MDSLIKKEGLRWLNFIEYTKYDKEELSRELPSATFIESKKTDTQAFAIIVNSILVIVFRGTEQKLQDWATDLNGFHQVYPYANTNSKITVHQGVLKAYHSIRDQIHEIVKNSYERITTINCVGHSLGGGLATLCAVDMQYNFITRNVKCYTYGALKVGNKAFVESYNRRLPDTYRFYIIRDVVPNLPPYWIELKTKGGYYHVSKGISLGPNNPFFGLFEFFKKWTSQRILADVTNHALSLYRKELT